MSETSGSKQPKRPLLEGLDFLDVCAIAVFLILPARILWWLATGEMTVDQFANDMRIGVAANFEGFSMIGDWLLDPIKYPVGLVFWGLNAVTITFLLIQFRQEYVKRWGKTE